MSQPGKSILVVERNPAIVDMLRNALGLIGYHVTDATCAQEAIAWLDDARLSGNCPAVILFDCSLSEEGWAHVFLRHLREELVSPTPALVIAMTTDSKEHDDLGVPVIHKPFHVSVLYDMIGQRAGT